MTIDLIVGETLDGKLADLRVPRTDLQEIRRVGRRRRKTRYAVLAGTVFLAAFGTTVALLDGPDPTPSPTPSSVPAMDFSLGARSVYDADSGQVSLGGQTFELGDVADLSTSAVSTPYGLVFFGADQSARFLPSDGRVRTLAAAPARPESFTPTVRYDNVAKSVAWLTRGNGQVTVSVYAMVEPLRLIASYDVPCAGDCASLRLAGHDQGLVFVSGPDGTLVVNPADGPDAKWAHVTDGRVVDVRNRVILSDEPTRTDPSTIELPAPLDDGTWRFEPAQLAGSSLTQDGAWEVGQTTTWRRIGSTEPFELPLPPGEGRFDFAIDSDGSVIVSRVQDGDDVYYDCDYFRNCTEFARFDGADGGSRIVGDLH